MMLFAASGNLIVHSDRLGLVIAVMALIMLCVAQVLDVSDMRRPAAFRMVATVASVLSVIVGILVITRFAVLA